MVDARANLLLCNCVVSDGDGTPRLKRLPWSTASTGKMDEADEGREHNVVTDAVTGSLDGSG